MARESNSDILKRYNKQLSVAKKWRTTEGYDTTWRRLVDLYRGRQFENLSEEDRIVVNIAFSTVNVIAPSVSVNHPKITVNSRRPDAAPHAVITEAVVNYWWRHYDIRPEFRRAVKDFLIFGHGWLKCGYRYSEKPADTAMPQSASPQGSMAPQDGVAAMEAAAPQPEGTTSPSGSSSGYDVDDSEPRTPQGPDPVSAIEVIVDQDRPFVERVSPFDVFVDPDATSMADARWIAQRIRRLVTEVKDDDRFSPSARSAIGASRTATNEGYQGYDANPQRRAKDDHLEYVDIWEYYDLTHEKICVFAEGSDQFLVKPRAMPYAFGHPFVMIRNYDVPDYFYPIGDLEALEPLQRELNATRSQMMNHRKKYSRKYLYKESAFDVNGRNQMESDADNVLVPVASDDALSNVVVPFPTVMTPPEFYNHSAAIMQDANMISAVSEYMRGGTPDIKRTATEAAITQDAANARAADKLATIEDATAQVARRLVELAQQFMNGEQVARITGADGEPVWVTFDRDYIEGEFDFEVEAGSTAPVNESFRRQMALQMVDAMAPFAQTGIINMQALAAHVLQFGFGVKNPDQFMQAPPPPMPPDAAGGAPPSEQMPPGSPGGAPPPPSGGQPPSQIDPAILAALASRVGLNVPNLAPQGP